LFVKSTENIGLTLEQISVLKSVSGLTDDVTLLKICTGTLFLFMLLSRINIDKF